jgi:hypothetical protein
MNSCSQSQTQSFCTTCNCVIVAKKRGRPKKTAGQTAENKKRPTLTEEEKREKTRLRRKKIYENGYVFYNKITYLLKTYTFPTELVEMPSSGVEQYKKKYDKLIEHANSNNYGIKQYK